MILWAWEAKAVGRSGRGELPEAEGLQQPSMKGTGGLLHLRIEEPPHWAVSEAFIMRRVGRCAAVAC